MVLKIKVRGDYDKNQTKAATDGITALIAQGSFSNLKLIMNKALRH
jgi:hypothetical protein